MPLFSSLRSSVLLGTVLLGLGITHLQARAATLVVTSTADTDGAACGPDCTLRQAINSANKNSDPDSIVFDPTVFATKQTIAVERDNGCLPGITSDLSITGPSTPGAGVTVDCADTIRSIAFYVHSGDVTLTNLTLSGAHNDVIIVCGHTTVTNCTFSNNGTALFNVSAQRSRTSDGKQLVYPKHLLGVVEELSTVTANNCTFSGNSVAAYNFTGLMTLNSCTLSSNDIGVLNNEGNVVISNSLIVGNKRANLYSNPEGACTLSLDAYSITSGTASEAGIDPAGLKDNGGPTPTLALVAGGKAVGQGTATIATDQRGLSRPETGHCDVGAYQSQPGLSPRNS